MNGLTRFLDWLDEAAAGFIRLAYLLAGITAVALYFGAGHLPTFIEDPLNGALPWILAAAVETHTYLSARRVRAAWQEKTVGALKVNLGVLAFLLAFSAFNQWNYLAETWIPPITALAMPTWLAYTVRALVVPGAFMAAAFLAPLAEPVTAQIENEARATLHDVFRIARRQRRAMLKHAEREGRDMTGALVELVGDSETRRIISHAYNAIGAPVQPVQTVNNDAPMIVEGTLAPSAGATGTQQPSTPSDEPEPPAPTSKRRVRNPAKGSSKKGGKVVRLRTASVQDRARAVWRPGMSVKALEKGAGISRASAQKYTAMFAAEQGQAVSPEQAAR